jgi:hypothetical protein
VNDLYGSGLHVVNKNKIWLKLSNILLAFTGTAFIVRVDRNLMRISLSWRFQKFFSNKK